MYLKHLRVKQMIQTACTAVLVDFVLVLVFQVYVCFSDTVNIQMIKGLYSWEQEGKNQ